MPVLGVVLLIAGGIMLARSALFWLYWIQTKGNRLDRIWLEIKSGNYKKLFFSSHRVLILGLLVIGYALAFVFFLYTLHIDRYVYISYSVPTYLFAVYVVLYALWSIRQFFSRELKLPIFTPKFITILLLILFGQFSILFLFFSEEFSNYLLALFEFLQPLIVLGIFVLAYTPNIFLHRYYINRARRKIAEHKNLVVIGITGSYGKTTTKEYLAHILSRKYNVLKTPAHINVDTGVAKVILRDLKSEHEIFIVEMGAYKRGEIKKICDLVRPQYAVLTGLSDQHLELFGSMEAIADAKFELVDAVKLPTRVFANEDSAALVSEFKRRAIMPTWYGISGHAARFKVSDVKFNEDGTVFMLHGVHCKVPAIGTASLNNLLGAITVAVELGMHLDDLPAILQDLPALFGTMRPSDGPGGALLIDDTNNANTEGVITALTDLARFRRAKKILVFGEVIELGSRTNEDHAKIAQAAAQSVTHVFLLPSRMLPTVRTQLIEHGYGVSQIIRSIDELKKLLDADTVVLFEGRDAAKILVQITK